MNKKTGHLQTDGRKKIGTSIALLQTVTTKATDLQCVNEITLRQLCIACGTHNTAEPTNPSDHTQSTHSPLTTIVFLCRRQSNAIYSVQR